MLVLACMRDTSADVYSLLVPLTVNASYQLDDMRANSLEYAWQLREVI